MNATNNIATDLFYKIRSRFSGLKLGSETGEVTIIPEEARFFDFDYKDGNDIVGHVSISLAEENSIKVYFSTGITESMMPNQKSRWYEFLKELRQFAKRRLMAFDTRDIAKDNLDQRDYAFLTKNAKPATQQNTIQQHVGESVMNESQLYGTKTVSYQRLMDTRLIIKHSQTLQDDMAPGARSRNISALFVENQDGERFKYPFVHLAGARAMQRHVANGGLPYDDVGKSIISMSEQIAQLRSFSNYVVRNDLMNSQTNGIVEQSKAALDNLREQIARLGKQHHYEAYKESFQAQQPLEVPEDVVEDFTDKFTVKNFKEDIKAVFPILYRLMKENSTVDYNDIVEMTTSESINDEAEVDLSEEHIDEFAEFENWILNLGETIGVTSGDEEERNLAVKNLQDLVGQEFPAGVNGENAITSLKGIIEDSELYNAIKEVAKTDPNQAVQPLIKVWLEQNAPEVIGELDFAEVAQQESEDGPKKSEIPAAFRKAKGGNDWKLSQKDLDDEESRSPTGRAGLEKLKQKLDITEVAEFIHSFYDRSTGTFPKGPEGVCTMVGKKFGEQAEQVARKFVERMAPEQSIGQDPELQELARMRELAGLQNEVLDYKSFHEGESLKALRDAIDKNQIVSVAFVKKDGTVAPMAIKKSLSSYKFSDKPKTDRQANVEQNHNLKKVININAYNKELKAQRAAGAEDEEAKSAAAKKAWRSVNLTTVLGFMAGGKFYDMRDENEIQSRFGDEIYNQLTPSMKNNLAQNQQASESFNLEIAEGDWGWDDPQYDEPKSEPDPDWEYDKARQADIDQDDSDTTTVFRVYDGKTRKFVGDEFDSAEDAMEFRDSLPNNDNMSVSQAKVMKKSNPEAEKAFKMQFGGDADDLTRGLKIRDDVDPELQRIKSLSGIGRGIGF
jgi:hypothetical protein